MASDELLNASALDQARLIRERKISSEELTRFYLNRISALNPRLTAFVAVYDEKALATARKKDAQVKRGDVLPAFHGIPMGIKDLNFVRGHVTRFGSRAVSVWSPLDCKSTASLRRAGFVIVGKTSTSELGPMPVTEPETHAPTRNPWDPDITSGGSSGGAGSAVAAGMLPLAHGSDGGGSVRIPASLNHLYGLKPSRGRVPNAYGQPDANILYSCGPLSRTVEDAAAMLDVLARLDITRPHWLAAPPGRFVELMKETPRKLRICLSVETSLAPTDPEIADAVKRVARVLEGLGHTVEERPAPQGTVEEFLPIWQRLLAQSPVIFPSRLQPVTRWLRDAGKRLKAKEVLDAQNRLSGRIIAAMQGYDLWLSPTIGVPSPLVGAWKDLSPSDAFGRAAALGVFTAPYNLTGQPAASIPAGLRQNRWPMGAQLAAHIGQEALLLQVSRQLEEAKPWRTRWAPLAA